MDTCVLCGERLEFENLWFDDFTRYKGLCAYCCVDTDEAAQEYKRLGIVVI